MPARAPRPGVGRRIQISQELKSSEGEWIRVICGRDDFDATLRMSSIGPNDERICTSQAGVRLIEAVSDLSSVLHISVLYWMARRKNGEKDLPLRNAQFDDLADLIDADVEVYLSDKDDEEDDEEGGADPTSSAGTLGSPGPHSPTSTDSTPGTSAATST